MILQIHYGVVVVVQNVSIRVRYVLVFVFALLSYLFCPGDPKDSQGGLKGPHLVAKGCQPSTGARSLAPIGGPNLLVWIICWAPTAA